jgi:hypothetical protein
LVRSVSFKLPIQKVRRNGMLESLPAIDRQPTAFRPSFNSFRVMLADVIGLSRLMAGPQISPDVTTALGLVALLEARTDVHDELFTKEPR